MPQHPWPPFEPVEVRLSAGVAEPAIDLRGGGLRRLTVGEWDVLHGHSEGTVAESHPWSGTWTLAWTAA